jgi:phage replication initiation protein
VDWLGLTLPIPEEVENVPSWAVIQLVRFGFSNLTNRHKGWFGYKHQHVIDDDCGLIAFGGEAQKNTLHIELTGKGCAVVPDWANLRSWCEQMGAKITRVDLAHDDHAGETVNIGICKQWLSDGLFSMGKRPPKRRLVDDLGTGDGCTLYIGNRANGKLFRGYEKGKQLGDKVSTWFRAEVELRAKDRVIPLDVLTNPTPYLAGAFPALAFLSEVQNKIKTVKKATEVSLGRSIDNARNAVGKLVNVLASTLQWEPGNIVKALQREGVPSRLKPVDRFLAPGGKT